MSLVRGLHWFRNDLRLRDNTTLLALADRVDEWLPVFIFDPGFLGDDPDLPRVRFLKDCVSRLRDDLSSRGVALCIREGDPAEVLTRLVDETRSEIVSFGAADTPLARRRDEAVGAAIKKVGASTLVIRDHTVFGPEEIRTKQDGVYSVYTPYKNAWWARWFEAPRHAAKRVRLPAIALELKSDNLQIALSSSTSSTSKVGLPAGGEIAAARRLKSFLTDSISDYEVSRDFPAVDGTSRLSPYLRFGVISPRRCFDEALALGAAQPAAMEGVRKWLDELVWREFYAMVLANSPRVLTQNFRREYDHLEWSGSDAEFEAWRLGKTGYPIVDAGMRHLAQTGWMHNRVRMIVASFLTKDLLIDWRRGARHFFDSLVDGDPASNSGGWQWAASTGTDSQPYFRIFNPTLQGQKWDPEGIYIRRFIPELRGIETRFIHAPWKAKEPPIDYPSPIVDHSIQRERALDAYRSARAKGA